MKAVIASCVVLLVMYLFGAFIQWELNPGKWDGMGRLTTAIIGGFLAVIAANIATENS